MNGRGFAAKAGGMPAELKRIIHENGGELHYFGTTLVWTQARSGRSLAI
jgi:hypothetical protein